MTASKKTVSIVIVLIMVVVAAGVMTMVGHGGPSDDSPDDGTDTGREPIVNDIPEGFTYDESTHILSTDSDVRWHITDNYHTHMVDRNRVYSGYEEYGSEVKLDVGHYTVIVGDVEFDVYVDGTITKTLDWTFRMNGSSFPMTVTYDILFREFKESCDSNRSWNISSQASTRYMQFSEMGNLVVVDRTIRDLEDRLESEYVRIGGSVDDRQGYADFIACFVQLAIKYPSSVPDRSFDYFVWGMDEYWCVPLETLYHATGDCEDTSALFCALSISAGYQVAMGGHSGHVFAGVVIDDFQENSFDGFPSYRLSYGQGITAMDGDGPVYGDAVYRSVETIRGQLPVGYLSGVNTHFGSNTFWGYSGFYPVSG